MDGYCCTFTSVGLESHRRSGRRIVVSEGFAGLMFDDVSRDWRREDHVYLMIHASNGDDISTT